MSHNYMIIIINEKNEQINTDNTSIRECNYFLSFLFI